MPIQDNCSTNFSKTSPAKLVCILLGFIHHEALTLPNHAIILGIPGYIALLMTTRIQSNTATPRHRDTQRCRHSSQCTPPSWGNARSEQKRHGTKNHRDASITFECQFATEIFVEVTHLSKQNRIPSRELTYPTCGKGTSSNVPLVGDMLVPRRVMKK